MEQELNARLNKEARAEERHERVVRHAKWLMEEGQEFYPWTTERIMEALGQASKAEEKWLCDDLISSIIIHRVMSAEMNKAVIERVKKIVESYWLGVALYAADKAVE